MHKDITPEAYSSFSISNSKVSKRKQGIMSGAKGTRNPLLTLGLGCSPSSSDKSKLSSGCASIISSSLFKEIDEESSWGQADTSFGAGAQQCDRFVRCKTDLCSAHSALVQDHCVHGGGTLGSAIYQFAVDAKPTETKVPSVKGDPREKINGDKNLLCPGISVPNSDVHPVLAQSMIDPLPEGRVHGGGLLALLSRGGSGTNAGGSELCLGQDGVDVKLSESPRNQ